jgi:hypothetical protein
MLTVSTNNRFISRDVRNLRRTAVLNRTTQRISTDADATAAVRKKDK